MQTTAFNSQSVDRPSRHLGPAADIPQVVELVASKVHIAQSLLLARSRCRLPVARARQLAMYLSHVVLGESLTSIGHAFGRDRTTVAYACGLIEDMRDDPQFDRDVSALEAALEKDCH